MASAAFLCNFSENECNKFNCWDFKLSNDANTVHVAAILRKLQQQEKVFKYLCTPPKRDLLSWRWQVGGGEAWRGGCSPPAVKKIWKSFQKRTIFQHFRPSDRCSNTFGGKCIITCHSHMQAYVWTSSYAYSVDIWLDQKLKNPQFCWVHLGFLT